MIALLYIFILPSPHVFFTSAHAVQYPCSPYYIYECDLK